MNFILLIIAIVISLLLFPFGILYGILHSIYNNKFFKEGLPNINNKFYRVAKAIDIYGNVMASELFNSLLIKDKEIYKFGNYGETISEVLGWNKFYNNLSKLGKILDNILDLFEKNHTLKSIKMKNLKDFSELELKALAYDLINSLEVAQKSLREVNLEIQNRQREKKENENIEQ